MVAPSVPRGQSSDGGDHQLTQHPAILAWSELTSSAPVRLQPESIQVLQKRARSAVYRLAGVGQDGAAVIAKRSLRTKALTERAIYAEILPRLPLDRPPYYGFIEDEGADFAWLFIGDAGDAAYSFALESHKRLAATWLATLHASAASDRVAAALPDRGPAFFRAHLESAHHRLLLHIGNPALTRDHVAVIETVVSQCETLAEHWSEVEQLCQSVPSTLVHGDFAPKNLRIRNSRGEPSLLPFDWGSAGWGALGLDLAQREGPADPWLDWASPDLAVYQSTLPGPWPRLAPSVWEVLAAFGKAFRCLYCVNVEAEYLGASWVEQLMGNLAMYQSGLAHALRLAGWP